MPTNRAVDALTLGARRLSVGGKLRQARMDAGMRLADVAEGIVSVGYLSMIEQGQRTPTATVLKQLAHRLGIAEAEVQRRSDEAMEIHEVCRLHAAMWADVEGDSVEAETLFSALATSPSSVQIDARWSLAHIRLRQHRDVEALDTGLDLLRDPMFESNPHFELAVQVFVASALLKVGEVRVAITNLEASRAELELRSDSSMLSAFTKLILVRAYLQAGRTPEALALVDDIEDYAGNIRTLPELRVRAESWWALRARSLGDSDLVGAVRFSERAMGLIQELWRADALVIMLAEVATLRLRFQGAAGRERCRGILEHLQQAVSGEPSNRVAAAVWLTSAELALVEGQPEQALHCVDHLEQIKPGADLSWPPMVRARAYLALGQIDEALKHARTVKEELRPAIEGMYRATQFAEPWEALARLFRELGSMDEAWECMRIAMRGAGAVPAGPLVTPPRLSGSN